MRDRKNAAPAIVGGSSLIMVFAVLCLTVFTLLTLSTVQADRRLSEVTAEAVSAYYAADTEAERIFAQLGPEGGMIDLIYQIEIEQTTAGTVDYHLDIYAK